MSQSRERSTQHTMNTNDTTAAEQIAKKSHAAAVEACKAYGIKLPDEIKLRMFVPQYRHTYMMEYKRLLSEVI